MCTPSSPKLTDLLYNNKLLAASQSQRRKKERVSGEQREGLLNFIMENPELVTRSSTSQSEALLWKEVTKTLNTMKPEKSVGFWKNFWKNWLRGVQTKTESSLTLIDCSLKKFLKNITENQENMGEIPLEVTIGKKRPCRETSEDIGACIAGIDIEITKLKLDIDMLEYSGLKYKKYLKEIKKSLSEKRKLCHHKTIKRTKLINKKRKLEDKENLNKD